jgi:pyruvate/2-oxoglutarate dehydrogenase complex dihydrolipoamide dehydrogenase (E3) component
MTRPTDSTFDVIVLGAGPAGEVAAGRLADGGLRVALVERDLIGGECSYWGCIPSKTLIRPGDVLAAARRVPGAASAVTGAVNAAAVLAWRDEQTGGWDDAGALPWLDERGITVVRGQGRLDGVRTVVVEAQGESGETYRLAARRAVVLATGTSAALPPVPGLAQAAPWDNRDVTAMKAVPRRLLVLGGGAVGLEMAQAVRRLGADEVTVVEAGPRLLSREEPFAGEQVEAAFRAEGIRALTGVRVASVHREGTDGPVRVVTSDGDEFVADEVLVAAGRRPATGQLGLETVGLTPGRYVEVDDRLRAVYAAGDGDWLYAVGDCNGRAMLTHMGKYQARIAADVVLGKDVRDRSSTDVVPRVTFTDPQVSAVGLTASQARKRGLRISTVEHGTSDVPGAATQGRSSGGTSLLVVDEDAGVVVGATFTGANTQELLHGATIAVSARVPLDELWHAVPAFPTVSEVWLRLLECYGL